MKEKEDNVRIDDELYNFALKTYKKINKTIEPKIDNKSEQGFDYDIIGLESLFK